MMEIKLVTIQVEVLVNIKDLIILMIYNKIVIKIMEVDINGLYVYSR